MYHLSNGIAEINRASLLVRSAEKVGPAPTALIVDNRSSLPLQFTQGEYLVKQFNHFSGRLSYIIVKEIEKVPFLAYFNDRYTSLTISI